MITFMEKKNPIIADTSTLMSLLSDTDANYKKAILLSSAIAKTKQLIFIPSDVFTETVNTFGKKLGHHITSHIAEKLLDSSKFQLTESTSEVRISALEKFKKLPNSVSYTDCLVMASADHFKTKIIFGFDEVFRKEGYLLP